MPILFPPHYLSPLQQPNHPSQTRSQPEYNSNTIVTAIMPLQSIKTALFALVALNAASTYAGCQSKIDVGDLCSDNPGDSGCSGTEIVRVFFLESKVAGPLLTLTEHSTSAIRSAARTRPGTLGGTAWRARGARLVSALMTMLFVNEGSSNGPE